MIAVKTIQVMGEEDLELRLDRLRTQTWAMHSGWIPGYAHTIIDAAKMRRPGYESGTYHIVHNHRVDGHETPGDPTAKCITGCIVLAVEGD